MEVNLPDLSLLQIMNINNVTFTVNIHRERYAKFVLVLIHPFQTFNDLIDNHTSLLYGNAQSQTAAKIHAIGGRGPQTPPKTKQEKVTKINTKLTSKSVIK